MYELIEHKKLDTAAASITFSNIPQIYTDLVVMYSVRSNRSEVFDRAALRFNGSSGTYTDRTLRGSGSGAASTANDISGYGFIGIISAANNTASTFASGQLYIPNYTSSTAKSWSVDCVQETNATLSYQTIIAGLWSGTDPVSEVALTPHVGTAFDQHSSATLYGINRTQALGAPKAIGGNITYANGYWVHTFTGSGSFATQEDLDLEYLIIAGGGGGGTAISNRGSGGGAGGYRSSVIGELSGGGSSGEDSIQAKANETFAVVVGAGGSASSQGGDSSFGSIISLGGGKGRGDGYALAGFSGGSGGGGTNQNGAGGAGTAGQGYSGGFGSASPGTGDTSDTAAGGGGGAGGPGFATVSGTGGNQAFQGGNGLQSSITGSTLWYAAGGTGAGYYYGEQVNGIGGGTYGLLGTPGSINGTTGTGSGGGGARRGTAGSVGGSGGSGVVIVRYRG